MKKIHIIGAVGALLIFGLLNSAYTVDQTQYAIVLQFGQPVDTKIDPGLHFKVPFVQNVIYLDNRLMEYDLATTIIYTQDKKNMVVDAFVRWRIQDPLLFYIRFKSDNSYSIIEDAKRRLGDVITGELKSELGQHVMSDVISQSRGTIMELVTKGSNLKLLGADGSDDEESSGLEVVDVRIKRADLPPENQLAVYERMKAERDQQATKYRSEGAMDGQKIRANADRERAEILAQANRASQEIRGKADAQAAAIYSAAYKLDSEFYAFTRYWESYEKSLSKNSTVVLTAPANMDYLKYFGKEKASR